MNWTKLYFGPWRTPEVLIINHACMHACSYRPQIQTNDPPLLAYEREDDLPFITPHGEVTIREHTRQILVDCKRTWAEEYIHMGGVRRGTRSPEMLRSYYWLHWSYEIWHDSQGSSALLINNNSTVPISCISTACRGQLKSHQIIPRCTSCQHVFQYIGNSFEKEASSPSLLTSGMPAH